MSASNRVNALSSAYDAAPDAAPSAVASLASRFNAAPQQTARPAVADKLSGIAAAFGTTVDQDRVPGRSGGGRDLSKKKPLQPPPPPHAAAAPPPEPAVVAAANPKVGDTAARFDGRLAPEEAAPNAFASAHERFLRYEADARPPADTRVSDMAKVINNAAKEASKAAAGPSPPGRDVLIAPPPPAGPGVGGIASVFERGSDGADPVAAAVAAAAKAAAAPAAAAKHAAKAAAAAAAAEEPKVDSSASGNDFASAALRFAEAEKRGDAPAADPDQPPEATPQSRFADAARLFGGS